MIFNTNLINYINNINIKLILFSLSLLYFIYLIFNFIIRIYNMFYKLFKYFKKNKTNKKIIIGYYIYNIFCLIFSILLISRIKYNFTLFDSNINDFFSFIFFFSILFALLYIDYDSENEVKLINFKFNKLFYLLIFLNLSLFLYILLYFIDIYLFNFIISNNLISKFNLYLMNSDDENNGNNFSIQENRGRQNNTGSVGTTNRLQQNNVVEQNGNTRQNITIQSNNNIQNNYNNNYNNINNRTIIIDNHQRGSRNIVINDHHIESKNLLISNFLKMDFNLKNLNMVDYYNKVKELENISEVEMYQYKRFIKDYNNSWKQINQLENFKDYYPEKYNFLIKSQVKIFIRYYPEMGIRELMNKIDNFYIYIENRPNLNHKD